MLNLLLTIVFATLIFVVFRVVGNKKLDTFPVLVINYVIAAGCALFFSGNTLNYAEFPVVLAGFVIGALFISIFFTMAKTTEQYGMSTASVVTKMSLIIPVLVGYFLFQENLSLISWLGIAIGVVSVYFNTAKKQGTDTVVVKKPALLFPILCFFGSGIIDASIQALEKQVLNENNFPVFIFCAFASAGIFGFIRLLTLKKMSSLTSQPILIHGIALGIINYFSIYFLILTLREDFLLSAQIFPIANIGILAASTLTGLLIFKEKISLQKTLGVLLACMAIYLISF